MPRSAAHAHLYEACRELHARLDSHPLMAGLLRPDSGKLDYVRALEALRAALLPVESAVLEHEQVVPTPAPLPYVPRAPSLERELAGFGRAVTSRQAAVIPLPDDVASCLGYRYVLEGAALGSRWMLQRLQEGTREGTFEYLRTQAQLAGNWPQFTVALNAALESEADRWRAAEAARCVFLHFCRTFDTFTEQHACQ